MNIALAIISVIALGAYVCRLDALSWRRHRFELVAGHLAGACSCAWVLVEAAQNSAGWPEAALMVLPVGWLFASFAKWRHGPPVCAGRVSAQS